MGVQANRATCPVRSAVCSIEHGCAAWWCVSFSRCVQSHARSRHTEREREKESERECVCPSSAHPFARLAMHLHIYMHMCQQRTWLACGGRKRQRHRASCILDLHPGVWRLKCNLLV